MSRNSRVLLITAALLLVVTVIGLTVTTAQNNPAPVPGSTCLVAVDRLGVYADPAMTSQKYGELSLDAPVSIQTVQGDWFQSAMGWSLWQAGNSVSLDCSVSGQGGGGAIGAQSAGASLELTPTLEGVEAAFPGFTITGLPQHLTNVPTAEGTFVNTLGFGTGICLAEPGTLLVGPDFNSTIIANSEGTIEYFNPLNQFPLTRVDDNGNPQTEEFSLAEGRFQVFTGGHANFSVGENIDVSLANGLGHGWVVIVCAPGSDSTMDIDPEKPLLVDGYEAGNAQVMSYPTGLYVSEGAMVQTAENVHANGNCGAQGCTRVSIMVIDLKSGGWTVLRQTDNQPWFSAGTNFSAASG